MSSALLALDDPSLKTRRRAVDALAQSPGSAQEAALVDVLTDVVEAVVLRRRAARALGVMARSAEAIAALAARAAEREPAESLGAIGDRVLLDPGQREDLVRVVLDMPDLPPEVADLDQRAALAIRTQERLLARSRATGDGGQVEWLEQVVGSHPDPGVRKAAVALLGRLAPRSPSVERALDDAGHLARAEALRIVLREDPSDGLDKALVPQPRSNLIHDYGVLASRSSWRSQVPVDHST